MKKIIAILLMFSLVLMTQTGIFASSYNNFSKKSEKEIREALKEEKIKTYHIGNSDFDLIGKEDAKSVTKFINKLSSGDGIVIEAEYYNEFLQEDYFSLINPKDKIISLFFVGNENIEDILNHFGLSENFDDFSDIYMVSYICIEEGCYPIVYLGDEYNENLTENKILKEQYLSIYNKEFYPEGKEKLKPGSVGAYDVTNNWTLDTNYWYISTDWYATDISVTSSKGTHYGDYREWTQVLLIRDLAQNQKEYVAVNKKGHMIPDNPGSTNDMRSYHLKPETDVDYGNPTFMLFDWMPTNNPTSSTFTISQGSAVSSDGSESSISVSYAVTISDLEVDTDGTNSIEGIFSPDFHWEIATWNNRPYNEEETVNCWGYIVQLDGTYTTGSYKHWHDSTNVKFLRDLPFKNYYLNRDCDTIIGFYIPTRDSNGIIID